MINNIENKVLNGSPNSGEQNAYLIALLIVAFMLLVFYFQSESRISFRLREILSRGAVDCGRSGLCTNLGC